MDAARFAQELENEVLREELEQYKRAVHEGEAQLREAQARMGESGGYARSVREAPSRRCLQIAAVQSTLCFELEAMVAECLAVAFARPCLRRRRR